MAAGQRANPPGGRTASGRAYPVALNHFNQVRRARRTRAASKRVKAHEYFEHSLYRCRTVIRLGRFATHSRYPPAHLVGDDLVDIRRDGHAVVCYTLGWGARQHPVVAYGIL